MDIIVIIIIVIIITLNNTLGHKTFYYHILDARMTRYFYLQDSYD